MSFSLSLSFSLSELADYYKSKGTDKNGNDYAPKPFGEHMKIIGKAIEQKLAQYDDNKTKNTDSIGGNEELAEFYQRKGMDTDGNRIEYVPKPIGEHCKLIGKAIQQNSRHSFQKMHTNYQKSTPLMEWKTDEAIANYTKETVEKIKSKRENSSVAASASASAASVVEMANELYYGFSDGSTGGGGGSSSSSTRSATAAVAASATTTVVVVDEKNNQKKKEAIILRC